MAEDAQRRYCSLAVLPSRASRGENIMTRSSAFDYAKPYDIFVGSWSGIASTFTPKGVFIRSWAYDVAIYWETQTRLHFRQVPLSDELRKGLDLSEETHKLISQEFDLNINGKYATSDEGSAVKNVGAETTPDVYIFHVRAGDTSWYNCQHCATVNERKIIGPQMNRDGNVTMVISQTYTRISYDVTDKFRRLRPLT
jgi:hypothetical protein